MQEDTVQILYQGTWEVHLIHYEEEHATICKVRYDPDLWV